MEIWTAIIIIFLCVLGESFFSGSEIAIVSIDRALLQHKIRQGSRAARIVWHYLKKPEMLLGTTLVGTNLCSVTSTTLSAYIFYSLMGESGIPISIALISFVNWIFAEIVPKSVYQQEADSITLKVIYILRFFSIIFYPLLAVFMNVSYGINRLLKGKKTDLRQMSFISREELKIIMNMKGEAYTDIKPDERKMINRLLSFKEKEVREVMVPLIDVALISENATVKEAVERFVSTKHRRLPVFRDRVYNIVGMLNSFDILGEDKDKKVSEYVRPAYYIPPSAKAADVLQDLQSSGNSMAIVVDEYGAAEGIVTIEDILEEIVGEIEDEYDAVIPRYVRNPDGSITVKGKMPLVEFNELTGADIPRGDYETVSGFIVEQLKRIPVPGERVNFGDYEFTVQKATKRAILEVKVKKLGQK